jgi:hypothetical protein
MNNVQNCDSYINIPSSQTYRSYVKAIVYFFLNNLPISVVKLSTIFPIY